MGIVNKGTKSGGGTDYVAGEPIAAAEANEDDNTLFTLVNGQIDNANIKPGADIEGQKLDLGTYIKDEHVAGDANLDAVKFKPNAIRSSEMGPNSTTRRYSTSNASEQTHDHPVAKNGAWSDWTEMNTSITATVDNDSSKILCLATTNLNLTASGSGAGAFLIEQKFTWNSGGGDNDGTFLTVGGDNYQDYRFLTAMDTFTSLNDGTYTLKLWLRTMFYLSGGTYTWTINDSIYAPAAAKRVTMDAIVFSS